MLNLSVLSMNSWKMTRITIFFTLALMKNCTILGKYRATP